MSKEDKIVIGQIGIGYWGPNLLRNFNSNKKCEIKNDLIANLKNKEMEIEYYSYAYNCLINMAQKRIY